ncbi:phospho-N-acetylmuramoyl-pentapeptide-transferase [Hymenobacter lutimineralis]|uniref:Phospho-N-acetylmuramoyl-pentapeptide-transferase n=1 Tax=Hymenobacter lutimineralis TaxID=2606448 RepID=A0A5D6UXB5_9BACT|nr:MULTISPECIES: phospho-N-acetylmuramoyl-pentapeptide-transferase [Hymenobacter]QIX62781.1 phospho-N-acetylmuramoyl-pentapeptide-transferase [Hymenobacter sp. BT18]TYZ07637.1 phospho-N-acetylmuramoyl-pentapeptide-transferase [Hymenobacter lutimineralis]
MLYYLFTYLYKTYHIPGTGVFQYTTFRAAMAVVTSLIIAQYFGKPLIKALQRRQIGEGIRDLGLQGQMEKKGTPTMGGLIILLAILVPVLLFAKLDNIYIVLMILSTVWLGLIGFIDDYIKVVKKDKEGLAGRFKVLGQIGLGLTVGWVLFFSNEVTVRQYLLPNGDLSAVDASTVYQDVKLMITTIPFAKNNELNYGNLFSYAGPYFNGLYSLLYIPIVILIITAVSNGANITDGLDGLAAGTSAIIGITLAIFCFVSGNALLADYLDIMYIPNSGELVIFCTAFVGACVGFLWYNSYPAQVFMGDTGSLAIGGIIAVLALIVRKELLIPVLCGIFLVENLSVMVQVSWFKYTKRKYGEGRRLLRMSPLHHHYQKLGYHESKIVSRFWIVGIMLAVITLVTLKLR